MKPHRFSFSMVTADRDGVAQAQQLGGAGNLTLNGDLATAGVATLDVPRHVSLYSAGNLSGVTFTVTGTDRNGVSISEAITGPSGGTVSSTRNFKTVTQIAASGAVGTNVEAGSADSADTSWVPVDWRTRWTSIGAVLSAGADFTYTGQYSLEDIQAAGFAENAANPVSITALASKTATVSTAIDWAVTAVRFAITSYVSGTLSGAVLQPGCGD